MRLPSPGNHIESNIHRPDTIPILSFRGTEQAAPFRRLLRNHTAPSHDRLVDALICKNSPAKKQAVFISQNAYADCHCLINLLAAFVHRSAVIEIYSLTPAPHSCAHVFLRKRFSGKTPDVRFFQSIFTHLFSSSSRRLRFGMGCCHARCASADSTRQASQVYECSSKAPRCRLRSSYVRTGRSVERNQRRLRQNILQHRNNCTHGR